jgi:succinyl-diaminopimelate desuccinylase
VDESSPFVQTLLRVFAEQTGQPAHCIAIGGGTYVHEIEGGVAFGAEFDGVEYNMHGVDEQVPIQELLDDIRIQAAAILALRGE